MVEIDSRSTCELEVRNNKTWFPLASTAITSAASMKRILPLALIAIRADFPIELENQFGPEWEIWLRWLGEARSSLYDDPLSPRQRRTMLHKLAGVKAQEEFFRRLGLLPKLSKR